MRKWETKYEVIGDYGVDRISTNAVAGELGSGGWRLVGTVQLPMNADGTGGVVGIFQREYADASENALESPAPVAQ